jgi:hypothetical protein
MSTKQMLVEGPVAGGSGFSTDWHVLGFFLQSY